jgi:hypothetical protein
VPGKEHSFDQNLFLGDPGLAVVEDAWRTLDEIVNTVAETTLRLKGTKGVRYSLSGIYWRVPTASQDVRLLAPRAFAFFVVYSLVTVVYDRKTLFPLSPGQQL